MPLGILFRKFNGFFRFLYVVPAFAIMTWAAPAFSHGRGMSLTMDFKDCGWLLRIAVVL